MRKQITQIVALLFLPLFMATAVLAEQDTPHKVIIQVSTDDVSTQKMALNNAANLQKLYGLDNVIIEIVAYGPGLGLLTTESAVASRVESLALQDIGFSACQNTIGCTEAENGIIAGVTRWRNNR